MKKEIKIALVAIAGIVILFFGMNFLKGMTLLADKNVYYATFSNISGLSASNPIFANGYQVGIVKDIAFDYSGQGNIVVKFSVDEQLQLPRHTTAEIESDFMGNVKMNLLLYPDAPAMGTTEGPTPLLQRGDTIRGAMSQGLMAKAATLLPAIEQMLPKVDSILLSVNTLLADPALQASLHNVRTVTTDLTTTTRQLNTLMASLNQQVPTVMTKADALLDNTSQLAGNLNQLDLQATKQRVDQTLANVEAITQKLNSPEGTVGLLMNDASLYTRLNATLQSADNLLNDFKEHPKRYVNVSVFGRKSN